VTDSIPSPRDDLPGSRPEQPARARAAVRAGGPDDDTVTLHSVREYRGRAKLRARARHPVRELVMLGVLTLMALADAYGFWITLVKLFQQDTYFLLVLVGAIALGTVAAAHELGRLARARREGYQASLVWMVVLTLVWLAVGATVTWMRALNPVVDSGDTSGPLAGATADDGAVRVAILLLVLYLLTGMLATTHAYQYRDPRSAELRHAEKQRERLVKLVAERHYEKHLAEQGLAAQQEVSRLHRESRERRVGEKEYLGNALHAQAAQDIAKHLASPSATSELIPPTDQ
jgi:hypothetical protein